MKKVAFLLIIALIPILYCCKVSYSFTGTSIDYNKIKTINIKDFINQAPLVYPPLTQVFNEKLRDNFDRNTKLSFVDHNANLEIEGEITKYDLMPMSVKSDSYASETRLTMTVRMRFRNNVEPDKDKEESFTAYRDFQSDKMLTDVQDQLIEELTEEIVDQIFNATMSDW